MLGPAKGTAVKLDADENVLFGLSVTEGVETALAARQLKFQPVWALGSTGAISTFPVLSVIDVLTLHEEADENDASARAVETCADRWFAAGKEVLIARPRIGKDANDAILESGFDHAR